MNTFPILTYSEPPCDTLPDPPEVSRPCPQKTSHQAGGDQASVPPKRSLNILCIDDDEKVRQLLNDCLTHFKHRAMVASGARTALNCSAPRCGKRSRTKSSSPIGACRILMDTMWPGRSKRNFQNTGHHDDRLGHDHEGRRRNRSGSGRRGWQTAKHAGIKRVASPDAG